MKILKNKKYYLILISILIIECILIMINSIEYGLFHSNANTFFEKIINVFRNFTVYDVGDNYYAFMNNRIKIVPFIIYIAILLFINFKNKLIKYNIGRNNCYEKEKNKLKLKIGLIVPIFMLFSCIVIFIITMISNRGNISDKNALLKEFYSPNAWVIGKLMNPVVRIIWNEIFSFIGIYLLSIFALEIADRNSAIKGILIFSFVIWICPIIVSFLSLGNGYLSEYINGYLPTYLLINGMYSSLLIRDIFIPIAVLVIGVFGIKNVDKSKDEII